MTTSIMCVSYNRLPLTKRMLTSLFATTKTPYHLIFIDNGSTDGSVEYLKTLQPSSSNCLSIDTHFYEQNKGIATGRNKALQIANKYNDPWLATIDNDVEFPENWLGECIGIMTACPGYSIGINYEGVKYPQINKNGFIFENKPKGNLGTACAVFPRDLHEKIGYFTTHQLYAHEDANFFFRARQIGYQLGYINRHGTHFGIGELDTGEYRKFKDQCSASGLKLFQQDCYSYIGGQKSIYVPFND